jgi:AcrR family transcriptional regulator
MALQGGFALLGLGYPPAGMARPTHRGRSSGARTPGRSAGAVQARLGKPSPRERLLAAMTYLARHTGYDAIRISDLAAQAKVSRQTFYDLFKDKEDLFLAAYEEASRQILGRVRRTVDTSEWWETPARAMGVLLGQIKSDPEAAWLFFVESMAAGARVRRHRNEVLAAFEALTADFLDQAPAGGQTLDIPPVALLGAIRSLASSQLRADAADRLPNLADDLVIWMRSYAAPASRERWSTGPHALLPPTEYSEGRRTSTPLLSRPAPLPSGRRQQSASAAARNRRTRILHATAEVALAKSYVEMTVTDIITAAEIGKDVFYEHFSSKEDAFLATQQYASQEAIAECARAFFDRESWPERVYNGLRVLCIMIAKEPVFAHLRIVETYAAGPEAIKRMEEATAQLAVFLAEGYKQRPEAQALPQICSSAIAGAVSELIRQQIAAHKAAELPRHVPQLTYVAIAPFLGAEGAAETIEGIVAKEAEESGGGG